MATDVVIDISAEGCDNTSPVSCSDTLPITLIAEASTGYRFAMWSDGNTDNPRTIPTGFSDTSLRATFIPILSPDDPNTSKSYSIVVKADECSTSYSAQHYYGDILTITATTSDECRIFTRWSDGNTDNPRSVVVTGDATYTAEFTREQYTITTNADNAAHGTVSVSTEE